MLLLHGWLGFTSAVIQPVSVDVIFTYAYNPFPTLKIPCRVSDHHKRYGAILISGPPFVVSHRSTDLQVAVMWQEILQCVSKGRMEKDGYLVNVDVNIAGFKLLRKINFAGVS